jgi:hypothetical protein
MRIEANIIPEKSTTYYKVTDDFAVHQIELDSNEIVSVFKGSTLDDVVQYLAQREGFDSSQLEQISCVVDGLRPLL